MSASIGGLVPPLVTPLTPQGKLDVPALERLLDHVLRAGVHGVFMLGTTGEAYPLSESLRREVVDATARILKGRVPLYVGVGDAEPSRVQAHAEAAAKSGADYIVLISPAYFDYAPAELATYFAEMAARMPKPVVLYNNPGVTRNPITPDVLQPLFTAKNIVGIKDSTGAADISNRGIVQLAKYPHFRWFEGIDTMIAQAVYLGAHGGVAGGANLFPRVYVRMFEGAKAGNHAEVRKMQAAIVALQAVYREDASHSTGVGSYLKGVKYGLHVLGICGEDMSWPFQPISKTARTGIERIIRQVAELAGEKERAMAQDHDHDHEHDHGQDVPSDPALRVKALESLLVEKGLVDPAALDAIIETYERKVGPRNGARVVAKAWTDPAYKARLLKDATAAIADLGYMGRQGEHMMVVENTPSVHNLVVCTLCSCYPWTVLGLPPVWYKASPYRSRAVIDPRGVLREFGLTLPDTVEVRVWDSTAEIRYLVLPERPAGTEAMSEAQLADLVSRDSMIGVAKVSAPAKGAR